MDFLVPKVLFILLCLTLIGVGVSQVKKGRVYVGYGERYLYGRVWVRREEDPILFWLLAGGLILLGAGFLFLALSYFLYDPPLDAERF